MGPLPWSDYEKFTVILVPILESLEVVAVTPLVYLIRKLLSLAKKQQLRVDHPAIAA
jgi:hypothetical protein